MKRLLCILLILALGSCFLSGCDRRSAEPEANETLEGSFEPETTVVGGLTQAVEDQDGTAPAEPVSAEPAAVEPASDEDTTAEEPADVEPEATQEAVQDAAIDEPADEPAAAKDDDADEKDTPATTPDEEMPFVTPSPQPNASVTQYAEISAPGLGFRFSYPADWVNIPGRSTVCYVQPLENGTVYPARVAVTMKRMAHSTNYDGARTELISYFRNLMTQYDESTFQVDTEIDTETKFMGKRAISTTYLAYDGDQEIKGYAIITYFERYLFVFHFLCAYEDYESFEATLRYMRDSVQADASVQPN